MKLTSHSIILIISVIFSVFSMVKSGFFSVDLFVISDSRPTIPHLEKERKGCLSMSIVVWSVGVVFLCFGVLLLLPRMAGRCALAVVRRMCGGWSLACA